MGYKMLVLDMDGTLLRDDKTISEKNKQVLKEAADKGVKVVISTGRIFTSARAYGDMIGIDSPIIASNGAYIREKDRDEVIYARLLGEANALKITRLTDEFKLSCNLFTWDTIYCEEMTFTAFNYTKWNKEMSEDKKVKIKIIDKSEWGTIIREHKDSILKAVIVSNDNETLYKLRKEVSKLEVEVVSSYFNNIEAMNKGVSKGDAVRRLADYYGFSMDDVICMGDSENDISMIESAGLGIVMENGTDITKSVAKFITLSNEDDGVAYAVEKFILCHE